MNHQTDHTKLRRLQFRIRARKGLIGCGEEFSVALHGSGKLVYAGTDRWGQEEARAWSDVMSLACGRDHIVALMEDGTLRVAGRKHAAEEYVGMLSCARTVAVGRDHIAVLLGNGHTVAVGSNRYGQCKTENWPTVTDVICGKHFTAGLTESGQILIVGGPRTLRYTVRSWQNVAGIFTDYTGSDVYAITADGKLISNTHLPRKTEKWKNLVSVSAYRDSIWAVTANGQLLSTDDNVSRMSDTKHYIACAVSNTHIVALTRDGQVLSVGNNDFGQCNTARFGSLYSDFDELGADRRAHMNRMMAMDKAYQVRMSDALRHKVRLACGKRLTVCINADGRVLATAEFPASKQWSQVRSVACGNAHVLALHENGRVSADGNDVDGCTDVSDWTHIKSIAAGKYHSVGLTENGTVLFSGRNDQGQGDVAAWTNIRRIATADDYTVGVTCDGHILIAGAPPFDPSLVDVRWHHPTHMIATSTHLVCLYADGTVKSTALPVAEREGASFVHDTSDWRGVRSIAAGRNFTLGLCYGGRVLATGCNTDGQCNTVDWKHVVDIGCGDRYSAALTADGRVVITGYLKTENRGLVYTRGNEAGRWQDVIAFRCGPFHMVALTENGQILSCGEDEDRQCSATAHFTIFRDVRQLYGYGQYSRQIEQAIQAHRSNAVRAAEEKPYSAAHMSPTEAARFMRGRFAIGMAHTITLDENGTVQTDGANDCGQNELAAYETAVQVAAGPYRSAAILSDGRIIMAGRNTVGQSNTWILNRELEAVAPADCSYVWKRVSCGQTHTAVLRSDGRVYAVGDNPDGRCDTQQWSDMTDIACGIRHTVAVRSDGTCAATGDNRYGQCDVSLWQNITTVAAGEFHTVALTTDGRVVAVGDNRKGQCNVADLSEIIAVACMPEATLCVRSDGHVVVRGGSGEANAAVETLRDVIALDTCEHRIAAMTVNGELILIPS